MTMESLGVRVLMYAKKHPGAFERIYGDILAEVGEATDGLVSWQEALLQRMTVSHVGKSGSQAPHVQMQKIQMAIEFAMKTGDQEMMKELRPAFYAAAELPVSPLKLMKKEQSEQADDIQGGGENPLALLGQLGVGAGPPQTNGQG